MHDKIVIFKPVVRVIPDHEKGELCHFALLVV